MKADEARSLLISQIKNANQYDSKTNKAIALLSLQLIKASIEKTKRNFL